MLEQDKNFVDPEDEVEEATMGYDTEDDEPRDDEPPPKDEN